MRLFSTDLIRCGSLRIPFLFVMKLGKVGFLFQKFEKPLSLSSILVWEPFRDLSGGGSKRQRRPAKALEIGIQPCSSIIDETFFNKVDTVWISQDPFPFCYEIEQGWLPISRAFCRSSLLFAATAEVPRQFSDWNAWKAQRLFKLRALINQTYFDTELRKRKWFERLRDSDSNSFVYLRIKILFI